MFGGACNNNGSLSGVIQTPYTGCGAGTITVLYSDNDNSGNPLSQLCTVNVSGGAAPQVQCPVVTISCEEAPTFTPGPATFTGACNNSGSLSGIIQTPYSGCGAGTITVLYSGNDACGDPISATCTVNVTGGATPVVACPAVTIPCEQAANFIPGPATFTGGCNNNGSLNGSIQVPYTGCGAGTITVLYSGTDACGQPLSQTCTVTVTGGGLAQVNCPVVNISCNEAVGYVPGPATFTGPCNNNGSLNGQIQTPFTGCGAGTILSLIHI